MKYKIFVYSGKGRQPNELILWRMDARGRRAIAEAFKWRPVKDGDGVNGLTSNEEIDVIREEGEMELPIELLNVKCDPVVEAFEKLGYPGLPEPPKEYEPEE